MSVGLSYWKIRYRINDIQFSGMIVVAQDSVSGDRIGWVGIGIVSNRILAAFMTNFGILPEVEGFIDLF